MEPFFCNVSADLVRRAMLCASTEETTRYYLNGVQIEPHPAGGALIVATDGSKLVVLYDPEGRVSGSAVVATDKAWFKVKPLRGESPNARRFIAYHSGGADPGTATMFDLADVKDSDTAAKVRGADLAFVGSKAVWFTVQPWRIDGSFPDWRRAIPDMPAKPGVVGAFAVRHIEALAAALADPSMRGGEVKGTVLRLIGAGDSDVDPILAFGSDVNGFGVVMPLRGHIAKAQFNSAWWPESKAVKSAAA